MAAPLVAKAAAASPTAQRLIKRIVQAIVGLIALVILLIVAIITPVQNQQNQQCSNLVGVDGDPVGVAVGALGGIGGTGITRAEFAVVNAGRTARITPGDYLSTAYGPPWGGIQGQGIATAGGLRLNGGAPKKYFIAIDPAQVSLGSWVFVWPNPYAWRGAFLAADTGGAIKGRRIDFYDWRGRTTQNGWGRTPVRLSSKPITEGDGDGPQLVDVANPVIAGGGVLVVGDSLVVGAETPGGLRGQLDGRTVTVNAKTGRTSTQGLATLRGLSTTARTWVMVLGTNDTSPAVLRRNVREIEQLAKTKNATLKWVTVSRKALGSSTAAQLNAVLRDELEDDQLIDWHAYVASGRASLSDGVHPGAAGYRALAGLIAASVDGAAGNESGGDPSCADTGVTVGGSGAGREAVRIAVSHLGKNAYTQPFSGFQPPTVNYFWCSWFVSNAWRKAGVKVGTLPFTGGLYNWAATSHPELVIKRVGQPAKTLKLPVGTALFYGTSPAAPATSHHVNMVRSVNPDGTIQIIGGNQDGSRVTTYGPCRIRNGSLAYLTGPGCDGRSIYGMVAPSLDSDDSPGGART